MNTIMTSLEWANYESKLLSKTHDLKHGHEVRKMIANVRSEITKLSKAEVSVRQGKRHAADELLISINQDIEMIEDYLLVAALIG